MKRTVRFVLIGLFLPISFLRAQVFPAGFSQTPVANNINNPTVMAFAPDGRIFICEQAGKIHVVKDNVLLTTPFLQLTVNATGERGLIGIAIDPDFVTNQYIYLYYTVPTAPIHNRISRFTANGDVVASGSEVIILELDNLSGATNHNGGAMHFGKDGKLYVAIGENATPSNAQSLDTYHGKLLRINKDGSVPEGNPFTDGSEQKKRIWAYGLRNPYTFSVQPGTDRIFVNDVGQVTWEEINDATEGGKNFGWPAAEGMSTNPLYVNPVYTYQHGSGDGKGCAITGGTFFNPLQTDYPGIYYGKYFFQDLCNGWINYIDYSSGSGVRSSFATAIPGNSLSLTVGNDGNLYYLSRNNKALYKIIYSNATTPFITTQPSGLAATEEQSVSFFVSAIGSQPLQYQWKKDGVDIPGAASPTLTLEQVEPGDAGLYNVVVTNSQGSVQSDDAQLTVVSVNDLPSVQILTPNQGDLYVAGTSINFSGSATDEEDGTLPADAFSWEIDFHHDEHLHDQPAIEGVKEGTFVVPDEGETSANVWYRFILTATDSDGLTAKDSVDVHPKTSTINLDTDPSGLQLTLDGQPFETPWSVVSVEGFKRQIGIISPQVFDDSNYQFSSWAHGGDETQVIVTPANDVTYTAQFSVVLSVEHDLTGRYVSLYPNPASAHEDVILTIQSPKRQSVSVDIIDLLGRQIDSVSKSLVEGENNIPVNTNSLSSGVYGIVLQSGNLKLIKRLIISK
ncbi:MAG TPA: PQQ-dependent sugar dehydrogenase [Cyclobacteriaceae bacterium]|nr:PQQ-dependent sugar dehydrogenase [Cyclobacteriaceae bacterium]